MPLFKRMAGSEFCSDAHRHEYQQEYSQLALGRLLQSHSIESQGLPGKTSPLASASAPAADEPAATSSGVPSWAETARPATTPSIPAAKPNGIAKSQPPAIPEKKAAPPPATALPAVSQPATAKPAAIQKPAPAELQFAPVAAPEFEHAFASLAPGRPRHQPDTLLAELPQGRAVAWERGVEIADSLARPMEPKLNLREVPRPTPRIALDLRIVPPESLETESRPLAVPVAAALPAEVSLWTASHGDFASELVSLSGFADAQFSKSDFEAPALAGGSAVSAVAEPLPAAAENEPPPEKPDTNLAEPEAAAPTAAVRVPDPELDPLPVSSTGIAPGRVKPLPVFGPAPVSAGTVQIPQPNGLPLRPVMVLAMAAPAAVVTTGVQNRKTNFLSLRSALSPQPSLQQPKTSAPPSSAPNFGLPGLPMQAPASPKASGMRTILAALGGAAVLGTAIFFFVGKQSDAGSKSPAPAFADGALGPQWIANFAPDAQRQRRVSLLRSSMNLLAYRLDFESSIRIKALGWVYRAQDPKNFYVGKIELQKPRQNPLYVLVHYAVINGVEQPRVETPLPVTVPMGGFYKIRVEAVGNRFTTWIQGQRVEQWTDARLSSGGAGLYSEGVEQSILHGDFVVTPLLK